MCQVALKKPLLSPSGLGDLIFGIENIASLISLIVNGAHNCICWATDSVLPKVIIYGSMGVLA